MAIGGCGIQVSECLRSSPSPGNDNPRVVSMDMRCEDVLVQMMPCDRSRP